MKLSSLDKSLVSLSESLKSKKEKEKDTSKISNLLNRKKESLKSWWEKQKEEASKEKKEKHFKNVVSKKRQEGRNLIRRKRKERRKEQLKLSDWETIQKNAERRIEAEKRREVRREEEKKFFPEEKRKKYTKVKSPTLNQLLSEYGKRLEEELNSMYDKIKRGKLTKRQGRLSSKYYQTDKKGDIFTIKPNEAELRSKMRDIDEKMKHVPQNQKDKIERLQKRKEHFKNILNETQSISKRDVENFFLKLAWIATDFEQAKISSGVIAKKKEEEESRKRGGARKVKTILKSLNVAGKIVEFEETLMKRIDSMEAIINEQINNGNIRIAKKLSKRLEPLKMLYDGLRKRIDAKGYKFALEQREQALKEKKKEIAQLEKAYNIWYESLAQERKKLIEMKASINSEKNKESKRQQQLKEKDRRIAIKDQERIIARLEFSIRKLNKKIKELKRF